MDYRFYMQIYKIRVSIEDIKVEAKLTKGINKILGEKKKMQGSTYLHENIFMDISLYNECMPIKSITLKNSLLHQ